DADQRRRRRLLHRQPHRHSRPRRAERPRAHSVRSGPGRAPSLLLPRAQPRGRRRQDRKSTRLNSSHVSISYAVFCLKKKNVKIYVGNAKQASYFYQNYFGSTPIAFAGPETGVKDKTSYLLQQVDIRLLLTTGLNPDHPISRFVLTHGDGVADIALRVKDTEWTYNEAIKRGAKGIRAPTSLKDDHGVL